MKMKIKRLIKFLPLLLLAFGNGCATHALWTKANLDAYKEPAAIPDLRLFDAKKENDLLVVYDEYSERNDTVRIRAYLLSQNEERIKQNKRPHFVSVKLTNSLPSIPVFHAPVESGTTFSQTLYAVVATNKQSFTLYSRNREISLHDLPVYNDGKGNIERAALTPVSVVADITIVGGFIGYWYLEGMAASYNPSY
jgi:hypothetical protein